MSDPASAAQRSAADPSASVFVTANAGSGKTKVLIDRIARLLLTPGATPDQFLCITYTKAAAAEMQRRLFERLGAWSVAPDATLDAELRDLLGADAEADPAPQDRLARARALFARALETPGGLKIKTIHAFCEGLLARFPIEAEAPPGFEIADDAMARQILRQAWARVHAGEDQDARAALDRFAAKLPAHQLEIVLSGLARRRAVATSDIDEGLARIAARHGETGSEADIEAELLDAAPWALLSEAAAALTGAPGKAGELGAAMGQALASRTAEDYFALFLNDEGAPRRPQGLKEHRWIAAMFTAEGEAGRAAALRRRLCAAERAGDARAAFRLAHALRRHYAEALDRAGALDFDDLIAAAHRLLTRSDAAAWVLYKLDGGVAHILIDEGQDTSPVQWDLLAPLQDEFFAGEGARGLDRTVFAVGDPKQSIYSFQGADPERFLSEAQHLAARAAAAERPFVAPELTTSFRSSPEILRCVDAVFAEPSDEAPPLSDRVRHVAARANEGGLVEWWPIAPHPPKSEPNPWDAPLDQEAAQSSVALLATALAERVKRWIAEREGVWEKGVLRPMRAGDIMALVRTRGRCFEQLTRAFKRAGLPVAGADRMVLTEEIAAQDLMYAARVAIDPGDDHALACLLKSPFFDLATADDAALIALAAGRDKGERLIARLRADPAHSWPAAFVEALVARAGASPFDFFSWLLENRDPRGETGWRRMLARLGPEARDPLEEMLSRALAAPRKGQASLLAFLSALEADESQLKREMEHAGDAVRILTAHGAKGLEAPVVLLPDTVDLPQKRPDDGLFFDAHGLPLWSPSAKADDEAAARLAEHAARRALGEHQRLLYVALTRARDRLIVCGHAKGQGAGAAKPGSWHVTVGAALAKIGAPCETPFGEGWRLGDLRAAQTSAPAAPSAARQSLPAWAVSAAPATRGETASLAPSAKGAARRRFAASDDVRFARGAVVHKLIETLPDIPPADRRRRARGMLATFGATPAFDGEAAIEEALRVLEEPAFAPLFSPSSRAEAPIVGQVAGVRVRGIVDRLVIAPDGVLIADYKTDLDAIVRPEYVRQLALYRAVLAAALPGRPVACALVFTRIPRIEPLAAAALDAALAEYIAEKTGAPT